MGASKKFNSYSNAYNKRFSTAFNSLYDLCNILYRNTGGLVNGAKDKCIDLSTDC